MSIGRSIFGGAAKSKSKSVGENYSESNTGVARLGTDMGPWGPQQDFIEQGLNEAWQRYQDAFDGSTDPFQLGIGRYAAPNDWELAAARNMFQSGKQGMDNFQPYAGLAMDAYDQLGAQEGQQYQDWRDAHSRFQTETGGLDYTADVLNRAGQYANSDALNNMIGSVQGGIQRNLTENLMPQFTQAMAAGGNLGNSRAGVESAILKSKAGQQMADAEAGMRGQAYQTGIQAGQADQGNMLGNLYRSQAALKIDPSRAGVEGVQASANLAQGDLARQNDLLRRQQAGGAFQREMEQVPIDNIWAQNQYLRNAPFDLLDRYQQIAGQKYGATGFQDDLYSNSFSEGFNTSKSKAIGAQEGWLKNIMGMFMGGMGGMMGGMGGG